MLDGLVFAFALFDLSSVEPRSYAEGRCDSREGREEAGDFGIVRVFVWDFDLD
jgi:hypothetical protein